MAETNPPAYNADVESQNKGKQIIINFDCDFDSCLCCTKNCLIETLTWVSVIGIFTIIVMLIFAMFSTIDNNYGKCLLVSAPTLGEDDRYNHIIEFSTYFSNDCEGEFEEEIFGIVYYSDNFNLINTTYNLMYESYLNNESFSCVKRSLKDITFGISSKCA